MTIDVEMLRTVVAEKGYEALTTEELTELLDAYEERERLRALLERASTFVIIAPWSTERVDLLADIDAALGERECAIDEILRLRAALREIGNQAANINHHCYQTGKLQCVSCAGSQELIEELARAALRGQE